MKIIRVFARRLKRFTPNDELAFVGYPPLWRPDADEVHISVTWTWDLERAKQLYDAWSQYYPVVRIGGPAMGTVPNGFEPGRYVRFGATFTSRGCNNHCPWCLVPEREKRLRLIDPIPVGYNILDNNFLQCPSSHRQKVYQMLAKQRLAAVFSGGHQASLVTDEVADELRGLRIDSVFLAADTKRALKPLRKALDKLAFLGREKLRVYTLLAYGGETIAQATARLEQVWEMGAMPFAQLYQPPVEKKLNYGAEWKALAKKWSRPASMKAAHRSNLKPSAPGTSPFGIVPATKIYFVERSP